MREALINALLRRAAVAWPPILVRYGEIGIKSRSVRAQFERRLVDRIEEQLLRRSVEAQITRDAGRVFVRASDEAGALDALTHTFGIVSASPAVEAAPTPEGVAKVVVEVARSALPAGASFAVRVKRAGTHAFSSLDVAKECASQILTELADRKPSVDLDAPDLAISAEIRDSEGFVFTRTLRGPGGLPLGSQGRVAVVASGPRAAHAAWLMGKRGSALYFLAADTARAAEWLAPLAPWVPTIRLQRADLSDVGEVARYLERHKCQALVTPGDAKEALASFDADRALGFPVFRPLVGYEGARLAALARIARLPEVA